MRIRACSACRRIAVLERQATHHAHKPNLTFDSLLGDLLRPLLFHGLGICRHHVYFATASERLVPKCVVVILFLAGKGCGRVISLSFSVVLFLFPAEQKCGDVGIDPFVLFSFVDTGVAICAEASKVYSRCHPAVRVELLAKTSGINSGGTTSGSLTRVKGALILRAWRWCGF